MPGRQVMRYNKLIRDRVPELIARQGRITRTRPLAPGEYLAALREKLLEEAAECAAAATPDNLAEECADLLEVIAALAEASGIPWDRVATVREQKARARGTFRDRLLLIEAD